MKKASSIALIALVTGLYGCGMRPQPASPQTQFLLDLEYADRDDVPQLPDCLQLRSVSVQPPFTGIALLYRTGNVTFEKDYYHQFLIAPDRQLDTAIQRWLAAAGAIPCSDDRDTERKHLTLEPHLKAIYADFQKPDTPFAVVEMRFVLTQFDRSCRCSKIVMDETVPITIPLPSNPAVDAVVEAMSTAARECLLRALVQLQQTM